VRILILLLAFVICSTSCSGGDRVQRVRFQGKPIFPIGVYRHPLGDASKAVLDDMAGAGFNCLLVPPSSSGEVLDEMRRLGIGAIVTLGDGMILSGDEPARAARADALRKTVSALKDDPAVLAWDGPDEPLWNWKNVHQKEIDTPIAKLGPEAEAAVRANTIALKDGYALVKSIDPDRPIFLNFAPRSEIAELRWFTSRKSNKSPVADGRPAADVFGVDIYPVPGGGGNNGPVKGVLTPSIAAVGAFTRKQREIAGDAPIYMVIQGCGIADWDPAGKGTAQRHPTFDEERFMAFHAVANGANGILWWGNHYTLPTSRLWSDIKRVARQLSALEPVLAQGEVAPVECAYREIEAIRYVWRGRSYVIAVNACPDPRELTAISWPGLKPGPVNVLFENRAVVASPGRLLDSFKPFEVHIYSDDFSSSATVTDKVHCAFGLPLDKEPFKGKSHSEVAGLLRETGITAVCQLPEDRGLIRELHLAGVKVYAEMSMFSGKRRWEDHPESRPINADGQPIGEPSHGHCGVCPNQDWLREDILDKVTRKFQMFEYDGLWLDFIRYPGKWEQARPALEECCFCPVCLDRFSKAKGVAYPPELKSVKDKAHWILAKHRKEWVEFKCDTITDFVGQIKSTMTAQNPTAILGIFNVPWKASDFDGAITNILAQDIKALAKHVDVFSPMVYHLMCHFPLEWVPDYTDYAWEATGRRIWPIVQTCDEPVKMSPEDVFQTLRTGLLAPGGTAVMMFTLSSALHTPHYTFSGYFPAVLHVS